MLVAYLHFPGWISAEIIPGFPIRWYGVMYLVAFGITYMLFRYQLRQSRLSVHPDEAANLFFWVILGLLAGGRIAATTIYDPTGFYLSQPWLIFWPFSNGRFVGLQGMSYHGGLVGAVVAFLIYCRARKLDTLVWADKLAASVPLGYTFGRIGNFINGELYGRISSAPWAMVFPNAPAYPTELGWVRRLAFEAGMPLPEVSGLINLPRHPSQLYEAVLEGIVLWLLLWVVVRPRKAYPGAVLSWYLIGYGTLRFVVEYFREPDPGLGFVLSVSGAHNPPYLLLSWLDFSMGQVLSAAMVLFGVGCAVGLRLWSRRGPKVETFDV